MRSDCSSQIAEKPRTAVPAGDLGDLFVRWQRDRDQRAREQLVERYMPLARRLALRYLGAREPFDDLLQVASIGLVKAIDRFDPERGNAFSSFAVPTILGELKRHFRDLGWALHVPRAAQERALQVEEAQRRLVARSGRPPTVPELARCLDLTPEEILDALEASGAHHTMSLDTPRDESDPEAGTIADGLGEDDFRFDRVVVGASIAKAAESLSDRDRRILALRFVEDQTQTQIALIEGVSQMQVSRVLRRAVETLGEIVGTDSGPTVASAAR